jgi:hypothetical protein
VLSGEVALNEVAVPGQRCELFDGFLLGHSRVYRSTGVEPDLCEAACSALILILKTGMDAGSRRDSGGDCVKVGRQMGCG